MNDALAVVGPAGGRTWADVSLVRPDGAVTLRERFLTFADPGRPLTPPILRLTGIRDDELRNAPSSREAVALFVAFAFRDGAPCLVGHNVGFDVSFLERAGLPIAAVNLGRTRADDILALKIEEACESALGFLL